MTWCRTISDIEGSWYWAEPKNWSEELHGELHGELLRELQPYSNETWAPISNMSTVHSEKEKKRVRRNAEEVSTPVIDAQKGWKKLKLDQFESAYRFELGGAKRA